jgi:hypothetical protein
MVLSASQIIYGTPKNPFHEHALHTGYPQTYQFYGTLTPAFTHTKNSIGDASDIVELIKNAVNWLKDWVLGELEAMLEGIIDDILEIPEKEVPDMSGFDEYNQIMATPTELGYADDILSTAGTGFIHVIILGKFGLYGIKDGHTYDVRRSFYHYRCYSDLRYKRCYRRYCYEIRSKCSGSRGRRVSCAIYGSLIVAYIIYETVVKAVLTRDIGALEAVVNMIILKGYMLVARGIKIGVGSYLIYDGIVNN